MLKRVYYTQRAPTHEYTHKSSNYEYNGIFRQVSNKIQKTD